MQFRNNWKHVNLFNLKFIKLPAVKTYQQHRETVHEYFVKERQIPDTEKVNDIAKTFR